MKKGPQDSHNMELQWYSQARAWGYGEGKKSEVRRNKIRDGRARGFLFFDLNFLNVQKSSNALDQGSNDAYCRIAREWCYGGAS